MKLQRGCGKRILIILCYLLIIIILSKVISLIHLHITSNTCQQSPKIFNLSLTSDATIITRNHNDNGNDNPDRCDTMHLAFVCGGFNSTRNFYVFLKSILFYRRDVIHLHLFVNNITQSILIEMFDSWPIQDLTIDYYQISDYEHEVSWITSQHYSNRFGLMKLVFISALEKKGNLSKVILLDVDMMALDNIRNLWRQFERINGSNNKEQPVFGLVENQSDWYLGPSHISGSHTVWPALGRGFNTGVILVDLVVLKRWNWSHLWRKVAEIELTSHLTTPLADQDIFNAVIRSNKNMIFELPCEFNVQFNDHTDLEKSCPNRNQFQLIHWNSPYKLMTKNPNADYFKTLYLTFRNWDGKLLEQSYCGPPGKKPITSNISTSDTLCDEIRPRPHEKLRRFLYFLEYELESRENDVSYVVHLSLDRIQVLDGLAAQWSGPISAAIYLSELETDLLLASLHSSSNLNGRKNVGYHLVFRDHGFNYPINRLRNIALNNALTPYVFLSDVDFLPPTSLYDYLRKIISEMSTQCKGDPLQSRALVVPAFESYQYKFDCPENKAELLRQLNLGLITMFRDQIWPKGHASTDYTKWRVSTKVYQIDWKPEYEPFIVTSKNVARFDERFVGFGWNKVEHIMQLAALNYEFLVLPEAFVIHKFHSASYDILRHRESFKYRACIRNLRKAFLKELYLKYPKFSKGLSQPMELTQAL